MHLAGLHAAKRFQVMITATQLVLIAAFIVAGLNFSPAVFGYHEVWHAFGVAAGVVLFVANAGLVEVPMGMTLRELIFSPACGQITAQAMAA